MTRATATLLGVAVAGFLLWIATQIGDKTTGQYWAEYGVIAGAGLVLALSQVAGGWTKWGRPVIAPGMLLALIPTAIAVVWIVVFHQPHANWFRSHVVSWSGDLGIRGFVETMGDMLDPIALGLGLVLGFCLDTRGARRGVPAGPGYDRRAADEPLAPDRHVVESRPRERTPLATTPAGRDAPAAEPPPRTGPPE